MHRFRLWGRADEQSHPTRSQIQRHHLDVADADLGPEEIRAFRVQPDCDSGAADPPQTIILVKFYDQFVGYQRADDIGQRRFRQSEVTSDLSA